MTAAALADAAAALVGTRFRLQGRDPATGLDCIGVLAAALTAIARPHRLPCAYRMKTLFPANTGQLALASGLNPVSGPTLKGDVLLVRISPCHFHLLIALASQSFVHAHAGLRRVVRHDGALPWLVVGHWRLTKEEPS